MFRGSTDLAIAERLYVSVMRLLQQGHTLYQVVLKINKSSIYASQTGRTKECP